MKKNLLSVPMAVLAVWSTAAIAAGEDHLVADFEGNDYGGWVATGTAFGTGPAHGQLTNQQNVSGFDGTGYVNSFHGGDGSRGTLTSPPFKIENDYITFLIGGGCHSGTCCMNLLVDGKVIKTATGLDDEHLDPFTWDVKSVKGQTATLRIVDNENGQWGHINVDQIVQTDHPKTPPLAAGPIYRETYRPQFHFTSETNWLNDPNGLVLSDGKYHMFYQHNPRGNGWGNMTWGHAISTDLIHWRQQPDAIEPDGMGTIFSGSAVVDTAGTSGFGPRPLVALYTAAGGTSPQSKGKKFTQCLAYSNDDGKSWTKYANNPVIDHIAGENRDPRLVWFQPQKKWVVALYLDGQTYALFSSPDLKNWTRVQEFDVPGCSECPDFFPIHLDGDESKTKWVMTAANGKYLVGDFDGDHFSFTGPPLQVDFGRNYYAVQSYSGLPDGRRVQIAWMRDGKWPGMPFNGQMSFPAEMTLHTTPDGPRLFRLPVKEIESLQGDPNAWTDLTVKPNQPVNLSDSDTFRIVATIDPADAAEIGFTIRGRTIAYSVARRELDALGAGPVRLVDGRLTLDILVDRTSIETFAGGGATSFTSCFLPKPTEKSTTFFARGGHAKIVRMSVYSLKSIWPDAEPVK